MWRLLSPKRHPRGNRLPGSHDAPSIAGGAASSLSLARIRHPLASAARHRRAGDNGPRPGVVTGFSLIELLVVVTVIGILAALLLPALSRAKAHTYRVACLSHLRQMGVAWTLHLSDQEEKFPDRRDLKDSLPEGYRPWTTWPGSDPRAGWAAVVLTNELGDPAVWQCPSLRRSSLMVQLQTRQFRETNDLAPVTYWMWRFDRRDPDIPLDNFWGKGVEEAGQDLRRANNPVVGVPEGPAEVEMVVDVYFPSTLASLPDELRGRSAHARGKNRLFLDWHAAYERDRRLVRD